MSQYYSWELATLQESFVLAEWPINIYSVYFHRIPVHFENELEKLPCPIIIQSNEGLDYAGSGYIQNTVRKISAPLEIFDLSCIFTKVSVLNFHRTKRVAVKGQIPRENLNRSNVCGSLASDCDPYISQKQLINI